MTARELIAAVEGAGGSLAVKGDKLKCSVPREVTHLIEHLRDHKQEVIELLKQRNPSLPWPGYNGGHHFHCDKCNTYFDTSAGFAKHQVYGCDRGNG